MVYILTQQRTSFRLKFLDLFNYRTKAKQKNMQYCQRQRRFEKNDSDITSDIITPGTLMKYRFESTDFASVMIDDVGCSRKNIK